MQKSAVSYGEPRSTSTTACGAIEGDEKFVMDCGKLDDLSDYWGQLANWVQLAMQSTAFVLVSYALFWTGRVE